MSRGGCIYGEILTDLIVFSLYFCFFTHSVQLTFALGQGLLSMMATSKSEGHQGR
jgi:hypothetical protein